MLNPANIYTAGKSTCLTKLFLENFFNHTWFHFYTLLRVCTSHGVGNKWWIKSVLKVQNVIMPCQNYIYLYFQWSSVTLNIAKHYDDCLLHMILHLALLSVTVQGKISLLCYYKEILISSITLIHLSFLCGVNALLLYWCGFELWNTAV